MKRICEDPDQVSYKCKIENYTLDRLQFEGQEGPCYRSVSSIEKPGFKHFQRLKRPGCIASSKDVAQTLKKVRRRNRKAKSSGRQRL